MPGTSVELVAVIDMTGSMESRKKEAVKGFNDFIKEQKKLPGECAVTAIFFNSETYHPWLDSVKLADVPRLGEEYSPDGMTPLLDAMGRTIDSVEKRIRKAPAKNRPKVIFVVITDGQENYSKKYSFKKVAGKVERLRKNGTWEFVFFGADLDSFRQGAALGIHNSINYCNNVIGAYTSLSAAVSDFRKADPARKAGRGGK